MKYSLQTIDGKELDYIYAKRLSIAMIYAQTNFPTYTVRIIDDSDKTLCATVEPRA